MSKFEPGEIQYSERVLRLIEQGVEPDEFLARPLQGDWGDINDFDKSLNNNALRKGLRQMSDYQLSKGEWLMIITNKERTMTIIQQYEEYLQENCEMAAEDLAACIQCMKSWNNQTPKELREIKVGIFI